ncbi:hypothetical protein Afil01_61930 [Actinorhabdospora filicis]|uniref:Uncharacterized protein n=1 Tax=Actinorhabdospora filicis TaxID=1785913 RepID=A0A9W6SV95_9ACTN|nr:hypothetical protein [Actinorhabdospora filicis]GLZ81386.1 hypothetical protein Afil01_61930 [Actinorhabdospora filicis]
MTFSITDRVVSLIEAPDIERGEPGRIIAVKNRRFPVDTEYQVEFRSFVHRWMTANHLGAIPDDVAYPAPSLLIRPLLSIGGCDVAMLLALHVYHRCAELVPMSRDEVMRVVTTFLWDHGRGAFDDFYVEFTPSEAAPFIQWAVGEVRRHFPHLDDAELADLLASYGPEATTENPKW